MCTQPLRQSDFTLEEILAHLTNGSCARKCFLANELGVIAMETKDSRAVKALCDLLQIGDDASRYAAYGYLTTSFLDQEKVAAAVQAFEANPANAAIIETFRKRCLAATPAVPAVN